MNALTTGALIILYLLVVNFLVAFILTETSPGAFDVASECSTNANNNATTCQAASEASFLETVLAVSVEGIPGAPDWANDLWVGIHAFLLTLAVILIVSFFIGLFFGGAA